MKSWLLLTKPPNEPLEAFLRGNRLLGKIGERFPECRLGFRQRTAVFVADDAAAIFDEIQGRNNGILAYSTAPARDLEALDGATFDSRLRRVRVCYKPDFTEHGPYASRMVRLEKAGVASTGQPCGQTLALDDANAELPLLVLDPIPLKLGRNAFTPLFDGQPRNVFQVNGVMLPPWREEHEYTDDSYFTRGRLEMRGGLARVVTALGVDEPAAISLWRLTDKPLLRDVFSEGGSLRLETQSGEPTAVKLVFGGKCDTDPIASYRRQFLKQAETLPDGDMPSAQAIAEPVIGDLSGLVGIESASMRAEPDMDWRVDEGLLDGPSVLGGFCEFIVTLIGRLQDEDPQAAAVFQQLIAARLSNEDTARRLFGTHCWRCPSTDVLLQNVWLEALTSAGFYSHEFLGQARMINDRISRAGSWPRLESDGAGPTTLIHLARDSKEESMMWRLLMPLGAVIRAGGYVVLDDAASELDRDLVLM